MEVETPESIRPVNNVKIAFKELQDKGIILSNRKLIKDDSATNFESSCHTIYYNPKFSSIDVSGCIFALSHEEGHLRKPRKYVNIIKLFFIFKFCRTTLREEEFRADKWAVTQLKTHYSPDKIVSGEKMVFDEMNNLPKIRWWEVIRRIKSCWYPSPEERLKRIKRHLSRKPRQNKRKYY